MRSYLRRYKLSTFVETGTYLGDTLSFLANTAERCYSIELSESLYRYNKERFRNSTNVELIHGDSATQLPELVDVIDSPALFWLDGHYSAGVTARAQIDTPVSLELERILADSRFEHVVLIDDAHCFDGTSGYPHLDQLLSSIRHSGTYSAEVSVDIVRLTPIIKVDD